MLPFLFSEIQNKGETMSIAEEHESEVGFEPLLVRAGVVANLLQISVRTLWRLNSVEAIPRPVRLGGTVRWKLDEIKKWIARLPR